jgi:hypothetical protein
MWRICAFCAVCSNSSRQSTSAIHIPPCSYANHGDQAGCELYRFYALDFGNLLFEHALNAKGQCHL